MPGDGVRGAEPGLSPAPFPVDPSLSPSPAASPPAPGAELSYLNGTFRLLQKPLRWHDALLLCESRNASLAHVLDPYTQAFLTQAARGLRTPLWIGLAGEEGSRRYSWVSEEPLNYVGWQDGEPQQPGGCTYVDVDGAWRTTSCDTKLQGAVCGVHGGECPPAGARAGQGEADPRRTLGHFLNPAFPPSQGPLLRDE